MPVANKPRCLPVCQVRLALDFRNKGRPTVNRDMSKLDGVATRYRSSLKQVSRVLCACVFAKPNRHSMSA